MLCYLVFSYFKMLWLVKEAVPERERIWVCDAVTTPFILGIIRPKIYLPSGLLEPNREYVIAHEQSHLRCKDHWWKPMAFVLLSVFAALRHHVEQVRTIDKRRLVHYIGKLSDDELQKRLSH